MKTHHFIHSRLRLAVPVSVLLAGVAGIAHVAAATLFEDNFETDTSANWAVYGASDDYTAQFAFDYGLVKYTYESSSGFVTNTIPPAPNSVGGVTKALKFTVNKNDDVAATAGVSAYPLNQTFSGNFAVRFDMWVNYSGGIGGGVGSTEFATMGINHVGDVVNWTTPSSTGDGIWFAVSGENGAARDYRSYQYDTAASAAVELSVGAAGLIGTDPFSQPLWGDRFPSPPFENVGTIGKKWVQVEVSQRGEVLTWKIDGFVLARRANTSAFNAGTLMLGAMDVFSSIADPKTENYVLFDNLRVANLDDEAPLPVVTVSTSDAEADEPSGDPALFTLSRAGSDTTADLTVHYRMGGTAVNGSDYTSLPLTAVIPAGSETVDVTIAPKDDVIGEPSETVILVLVPDPSYELFNDIKGTATLTDSGDLVLVSVAATDAWSYERLDADTLSFTITRQGDISVDLEVPFQLGGTATAGTDYVDAGGSVIIPANAASATVVLTPVDDALLEGNETVELTLSPSAAYEIRGAATVSGTIVDDEQVDGSVLFADGFESDSSAGWTVKFSAANGISDYVAVFGYDYSADGIPPAPHSGGTTFGLKATVNKNDAVASASALNIFVAGSRFSGDYALRFDLYLTYDAAVAGTTEHSIFGVNHAGTGINRHGVAGTDGLWFAAETDASASSGRSYVRYFSTNPAAAPGLAAKVASEFAPYFTKPPYRAAGAVPGQWVDVEVAQVGGVVTWKINGITIFSAANGGVDSGTIMLGHADYFNSIGSVKNFSLYDNVRVVYLGQQPRITGVATADGKVLLSFISVSAPVGEFKVERADAVGGPYQVFAGATVTALPDGSFSASLPIDGRPAGFFRIVR